MVKLDKVTTKKRKFAIFSVKLLFLQWHIAREFTFKWGWIGIYGSFSHPIIGFAIGLENIDMHILFMHFKVCWVNER